jgi:hypothetical protein
VLPQVDAEYVARMEDVLDLYAEAPDLEGRPTIARVTNLSGADAQPPSGEFSSWCRAIEARNKHAPEQTCN